MKKGQKLLISFRNKTGNIFGVKELELDKFGLSNIVRNFNKDLTLIVSVAAFNNNTGSLLADIEDYTASTPDNYDLPEYLTVQIKEIREVRFRNISTLKILKLSTESREARISLPTSITDEDMLKFITRAYKDDEQDNFLTCEKVNDTCKHYEGNDDKTIENTSVTSIKAKSPQISVHKEKIFVPFSSLRFIFGGVAFDYYFEKFSERIEITITNDNIREEFEAVKNYFQNVLKTKEIQVYIKIETLGKEIKNTEGKSPEISSITKDTIENIRFEFIKDIRKGKFFHEIDKTIFTPEELYSHFDSFSNKASSLYQNPVELLDELKGIKSVKHYKHLCYLSSVHAHDIMKLRFVLKPVSFIFLVKGKKYYHFIWETLDTEEATWIWRSGTSRQELKRKLAKIEDILNVIKVQGKTAYINSKDDKFHRIIHDYSDIIEGFVKWKYELESLIC